MRCAATLVLLGGCAWAAVPEVQSTPRSTPSQVVGRELVTCTTSSGAVKGDFVGAVVAGLFGGALVVQAQSSGSCVLGCNTMTYGDHEEAWGIALLGVAAAYAVSGFTGHARVVACDSLHATFDAQAASNPTAFGFPPPPAH